MDFTVIIASPNLLRRQALRAAIEQARPWRCLEADTPDTMARLALEHPLAVAVSELDTVTGLPTVTLGEGELRLPFKLSYLLETILAASPTAITLPLGWSYLPRERLLRHNHKPDITFTEKEGDLLLALLRAKSGHAPRKELLARVWGYGDRVDTHTLETHIHRLRGKLKDIGGEEWIVTTDAGYRFNL